MKYHINIVEYGIMNNDWEGWSMARIELHKEGEHYQVYEGFVRLPTPVFETFRESFDFMDLDKLPYMRFDYEEPQRRKDESMD